MLIRSFFAPLVIIPAVFALTGCPGVGDSFRPHEVTSVTQTAGSLCFKIEDPLDYQPTFLSISPRNVPTEQRLYSEKPNLSIANQQLCIPPSFYSFPADGQFIVDYTLVSAGNKAEPRRVILGLEFKQARAKVIPLWGDEM